MAGRKAAGPGRQGFFARLSGWKNTIWFRVSICFIIVATLPLLLLATAAALHTGSAVYGHTTRFSKELVNEVGRNIQREINALQNTSIDIAYSDAVQQLCGGYAGMGESERKEYINTARLDIAYKLTFNREVTDVLLYTGGAAESMSLYGEPSYRVRLQPEYEAEMLASALEGDGRLRLYAYGAEHQQDGVRLRRDTERGTTDGLLITRAIRSLPDGEVLGVLALRLNARFFNGHLQNIQPGENTNFLVYDDTGRVMLTTAPEVFGTGWYLNTGLLGQLAQPGEEYNRLDYGGDAYMVYQAPLQEIGWTAALLVPKVNLDREIWAIWRMFILLLVLVLCIVVVGIQVFHRILNRPLIRLVEAINAADGGNLHVEVENTSPDEIGQAARSFNNMLARIRRLLDNVKREEEAKHEAELAALQAQINPHFLSNTLGAARVMAQNQKAGNIDKLLAELIELLHISMDRRRDMIPLSEEIQYVQRYVQIMQYKSYLNLDVRYQIEQGLAGCMVPKLVLQPLVENALVHGVHARGQTGRVVVRAVADEGDLLLNVTDNGVGIPAQKLGTLLSEEPPAGGTRFSGVGLPNVHQRLRRLFGEEYGLTVDSVPNLFTSIEIRMPMILGEGEENGSGPDPGDDR